MKSSDLRQKAEIRLLERQLETGVVHSEAEAFRVVRELEIYQIELEMVNEELVIANELAIKLAKNKYIELYDFAPNGYLTISKGGEIIELNLAAAEILGKDSLQLNNSLFGFFIHEYSKQVFSEFLDKIFDQRVKRFCDLTLICRNNTTFYVTLAGIADKNGEKCLVSIIDITERMLVEAELILANKALLIQNNEKSERAAELVIANQELVVQNEEKAIRAAALVIANKELLYQNEEKENRAAELVIANRELIFQTREKANRAAELIVANKELLFQNDEKENRAAELLVANRELLYQNNEKSERAAELVIANQELVVQNEEKAMRAAELVIANKELLYQNEEKENRAAELVIANRELIFQTAEKANRAAELILANKELLFQNEEKENRAAELLVANRELLYQNHEKSERAAELVIANQELVVQNEEKAMRAAELVIANKELLYQNEEKENRAAELVIANRELMFQTTEKANRAAELIIANKELLFQNDEKENRAAELVIANRELIFQTTEKANRAAELIIANKELLFQNNEKENRAAELLVANRELLNQNNEKSERAAELVIANQELMVQNNEKAKRAAELVIANKELLYQNEEKENRAAELVIANQELTFQTTEKANRAAELIVANKELLFQNEEKENRAAELVIANQELIFQTTEKANRAAELIVANAELLFQNEEKAKRVDELVIANLNKDIQREILRKSQQQYHNLVENASVGIFVAQGEYIRFANPCTSDLFGYSDVEMLTLPFLNFVHPEDRDFVKSNYIRRINEEQLDQEYNVRILKKDQKYTWIAIHGVKIEWEGEPATLNFINDIDARIKAAEVLKQLTLRYGMAIRAGKVGVWDYDILNNVLIWDDQMLNLYGVDQNGFGGTYEIWQSSLHPEDLSMAEKEFQMAIRGEKEFDTAFRIKWLDGSIHHIRALGFVQCDSSGTPLRVIGTNWDISGFKENEASLILAREEAEAGNIAKSEFLANISHELRTPLNGVIGFTDLLLKTSLNKVQRQYAQNANFSGLSLLGIINEILDFIKLESEDSDLLIVKDNLIESVGDLIEIVNFQAHQQKLEFLINIQPDIPNFIYMDKSKVKRILINLIGNALKFTVSGEIELKISFVRSTESLGELSLSVRDTGVGISSDQQQSLFQLFAQADNSTTRRVGGLGLGLTISNLLAREMGSEIELQSEVGKGSVFSFKLKTTYLTGEQDDIAKLKKIKRVLVIDDNSGCRSIFENNFTHWGIEFVGIDNGHAAIELLKGSKPFDIILVDYHLPVQNGLETIRLIRENVPLLPEKQIFILLQSTFDDFEICEECERLRVTAKLNKPVKRAELFQCLTNLYDPLAIENRDKMSLVVEPLLLQDGKIPVVLIVEDEMMNMTLVTAMVKRMIPNVKIYKAKNGREAYEKAISKNIHLILMDIQMPVMSGIEATIEIRNFEKFNGGHVPIAALTAGFDREKCLNSGMDEFMTKPLNANMLNDLLTKYLEVFLPSNQ